MSCSSLDMQDIVYYTDTTKTEGRETSITKVQESGIQDDGSELYWAS